MSTTHSKASQAAKGRRPWRRATVEPAQRGPFTRAPPFFLRADGVVPQPALGGCHVASPSLADGRRVHPAPTNPTGEDHGTSEDARHLCVGDASHH